jgi:hypothetical protein
MWWGVAESQLRQENWEFEVSQGYIVSYTMSVCVKRKKKNRLGTVAHTCNFSYLGGKDQEDCGSNPAWTKSP